MPRGGSAGCAVQGSCLARCLKADSLLQVCMLPIGTQEQNIMGINEVEAG